MRKLINVSAAVLSAVLLFAITADLSSAPKSKRQYYEIRIYHLSDKSQEAKIDSYLKNSYIPALHRAGILKAGVFKPVETDTAYGKRVYLFIPFSSVEQFVNLQAKLDKDNAYIQSGKEFTDAPYNEPPFNRYQSILLKAFEYMPVFRAPVHPTPPSERIYELRDYESATDAKAVKKIEMFNQGGEMKLFEKLGFNAVFFGEVLMGSSKPNLMYMISFPDIKSREDHWTTFRNDPEWKRMSGLEEYKNTVSKVKYFLLHPTDYSDF